MLRTDKSFLGIHPDLETPIQQFYRTKKEQRDEIYNARVQEFYLKEKISLKNPTKFLKEHSTLASALRKSSLDFFSLRSKRDVDHFEINTTFDEISPNADKSASKQPVSQLFARKLSQLPLAIQRSDTNFSGIYPSSTSPTMLNNLPPKKRSVTMHQRLTLTSVKQVLSTDINTIHITNEPEDQRLNADPFHFNTEPAESVSSQSVEEDNSLKVSISQMVQPSLITRREFRNHKDSNPLARTKHSDKPKLRKTKTIRQVDVKEDLKERENARENAQYIAQMNFLNLRENPGVIDVNEAENFKFVFAENKDSRLHEIIKQKHLKLGVFSSRENFNYLQHSDSPKYSILKRIQRDQKEGLNLASKIITVKSVSPNKDAIQPKLIKQNDASAERPHPGRANTALKKGLTLSLSEAVCNQYGLLPPVKQHDEPLVTEPHSATITKEYFEKSNYFLTTRSQDSGYSTSRTINSDSQRFMVDVSSRARVPPIHCHGDLPDVSEICNNQQYTNLVQKSINNKRLFQRKDISRQISRKNSADAAKMSEFLAKRQSNSVTVQVQTN